MNSPLQGHKVHLRGLGGPAVCGVPCTGASAAGITRSTGALAGALVDDGEDGGYILLGGFAAAGLGYVIGSRFEGWNLALPCVHLCGGWETERLPAPSAAAAPAP